MQETEEQLGPASLSQEDRGSTVGPYYATKQAPPLEGCIGLLVGSLALIVLGSIVGSSVSTPPVGIAALAGAGVASVLWIARRRVLHYGRHWQFAMRCALWSLFVFTTILIIAIVRQVLHY
jgi:hypothetical protein